MRLPKVLKYSDFESLKDALPHLEILYLSPALSDSLKESVRMACMPQVLVMR